LERLLSLIRRLISTVAYKRSHRGGLYTFYGIAIAIAPVAKMLYYRCEAVIEADGWHTKY
jgi:hypothetical protein